MAPSDKVQTHKQYKRRKKRIKKASRFEHKDSILKNQVEDIDREIERLEAQRQSKLTEINKIEEEKQDCLMNVYNDIELIEEITRLARKTTFPPSIINEIKDKCKNGINKDDVQYSDIESLIKMDMEIIRNVSHTNVILDSLASFGGFFRLSKEDENNDND